MRAAVAEVQLLAPIASHLCRGAVVLRAVRLHDHPLTPQRVHVPARDPGVELGQRQALRFAELEEHDLQATASEGQLGLMPSQSSTEIRGSRAALPQFTPDHRQAEGLLVVRLREGPAEFGQLGCGGEIAKSPGERRDRQAPVPAAL